MSATKSLVASDSAAEFSDLIGDGATGATFESDPRSVDSDPTDYASTEKVVLQRDTDDTEDSEEEEDELEDEDLDDEDEEEDEELEDDDDDDDDEDGDEEDDEEVEDDEDEVGARSLQASGSTNLRGPVVNGKTSIDSALEDDDDAGDETEVQDGYLNEGGRDESEDDDSAEKDRGIDAALRMSALVRVTSEFAANV